MTDKEIIEVLIEKAKNNGWEDWPAPLTICDWEEYLSVEEWSLIVMFDVDFAKALWGEEKTCRNCGNTTNEKKEEICWCDRHEIIDPQWIPEYLYRLQQLAISENRIEYLKQFIDEN